MPTYGGIAVPACNGAKAAMAAAHLYDSCRGGQPYVLQAHTGTYPQDPLKGRGNPAVYARIVLKSVVIILGFVILPILRVGVVIGVSKRVVKRIVKIYIKIY